MSSTEVTMKQIDFVIDQDGNVEIDQTGWTGSGCGEIAEQLIKAVGKKVKQTKKCEYYARQTEQSHSKQQQKINPITD